MSNTLRRTAQQLLKTHKYATATSSIRQKTVEKNILTSVYKDIPVTNMTINDFVWQNLDRWPDKTATVCALTGHGYTYAQTHRMSVTFAASLRSKLKLKNDDKVAVILPNLPEYPCTLLGILQAGCVASMMNPVYTSHELKRQLELIDCKAIVSSKISYANIKQALDELKVNVPIILVDNEGLPEGAIKFAELAEDFNVDIDCLKSVQRGPKDVAILPFSSGTTGFPKAVVLDHGGVVALNQMIIDPEIVVIEETTVVFLGKHPAVKPEHLAAVKGMISGAAPLSAADAAAVLEKNKNIIFRQGYGLTETNGAVTVGRNDDTNHAAVGHVLGSCEVKVADVNTQEALGAGQEGEIWCRGPNLMSGYYLDEKSTREVMTEDGWYKTGDIGKYDENKYLYVTDRLKELIKVKGFQVPPAELETVIRTHSKVLDCAVLGIPDPVTGEVPKAFIVPQQGQTLDADELLEYVNSKVAVFKKIKEVQFVEEIPKNSAGKILRKQLKEKYC
uniref:Uncharacterized protein n=1 Tax=Bombyx mori TaxID=7091 RepID=A0A8R2M2X1_BOMMO|nr:4-coumarate--CoA ligase 3 isoform X2 [Bombyx mori]